ncbi:MAG: YiiD C-terminal domain-containing protein [Desulfobacter sp.]|nr:MAG: YiiD C-terminal domain-containing protein [Desulfobacter sp.]
MDLTELKNIVETQFDFLKNMGLRVLDIEPGRVRLMLPKQGNENHLGTVWAGALFTLAEVPGGILAFTLFDGTRFYPVVREMNIKYLKPATSDVTVEFTMDKDRAARLEARAREAGKADFALEGEVKDAQGNVVAVTKGDYQLRKY